MTVSALVNTERPIILIYNPDQGRPDEYAEIEFKTAGRRECSRHTTQCDFQNGNPDHIQAAAVEPLGSLQSAISGSRLLMQFFPQKRHFHTGSSRHRS
jgi:hypothetical protein